MRRTLLPHPRLGWLPAFLLLAGLVFAQQRPRAPVLSGPTNDSGTQPGLPEDSNVAPAPPAPANSGPADADHPVETLKVNVNVVNIFCNVKDKRGALVPNLNKSDFQITEDGVPQTLKYFSAVTNQPITLGLLMDTSGSMYDVLPAEQEVGANFLAQLMTYKDEAFLISFDTDTRLVQDYTSSAAKLRHAMNELRITQPPQPVPGVATGPFPNQASPGTTLYDAIYLAAHDQLADQAGRKALIIMSDGVDEGSKTRLTAAIEAAQKADAICYVLLFTRGIYGAGGEGVMKRLAEDTGGRLFEVSNRFDKLQQAFSQIAQELRTQYLLGYTPTNQKRDGGYRKIEVKAAGGDRVQTRKGYYAPVG